MKSTTRYKIRKIEGRWQVHMNRKGVDPDGKWVKLAQLSDWKTAVFVATYDTARKSPTG